jgi:hypothetical protein
MFRFYQQTRCVNLASLWDSTLSKLSFNKLITTVYTRLLNDIGESATATASKTWFEIVDGNIVYFDQTDAIVISSDDDLKDFVERFMKKGKFNPPKLMLQPASMFAKNKQVKTLTTGVSGMLKAMGDTTFKLKIDYGIGKGTMRMIVAHILTSYCSCIQPSVSSLSTNSTHQYCQTLREGRCQEILPQVYHDRLSRCSRQE